MKGHAWPFAVGLISVAAIATTGWSLAAVARHYGAPWYIAVAAPAVYDGAAYACLHLASVAAAAGRSAIGARLAALCMATVSVYLNRFHADLIRGGLPATALFAAPTVALLLVSELSWAGPRAEARSEQPFRLPVFGGWAWLLAPGRASSAVKDRALAHIEGSAPAHRPDAPGDAPRHTATEVLRRHFAGLDPVEAIRVAHQARPELNAKELAAQLVTYGVIVDSIQVALVLNTEPPEVYLERDDAPGAPDDAPQVGAGTPQLPAIEKSTAILEAASALGDEAKPRAIVDLVRDRHGLTVKTNYVRTVLWRAGRAKKEPQSASPPPRDGVGQGGGGYA
ncbi:MULTISPECIES: hypothetical protein [Streptomycetaceae]|uniref:DUF2637 domain-containing protein n=1 Tax=Streptantibioticus cattleyicolor (strain ATCC 35852 / DSM 46488 / JCM 4925 / NBRC 14057 / NRRL 8057) TaxID=1003195 RepID=F8JY47_STREN|nr:MULTISPECIES: hypothetical protein [Streptomycetaceae]AEW94624.1 hypothetical protein SCATT_22530 [Streptantibioticus cattleyicolor NRRL 8057 = DSM 46488]MYS59261.1 hypothetical protein [Streptomyces sp. SID5468]CCB74980.1 membrane protein of unknown function [Streptantibioticus cattleyicolor NRRL 8057 = DSM 46488]